MSPVAEGGFPDSGLSAGFPSRARALSVLGSASNETNVELVQEWRRRGVDAALLSPLAAQDELGRGDLALARLDVLPTLDGIEAGLLALLWLERRGTCVLNRASTLLAVHDKLRTAALLGRAGLPHPRVAWWRGRGGLPLEPPLVVKPRFGSWGADVMRCRDRRELERAIAEIRDRTWFRRHGALLQELLPPAGEDLRLIVAGGTLVGASRRVARLGEWRTNVSLGGTLEALEPPPQARSLAIAAASAVAGDLIGVDLFPLDSGRYAVLELNGAVEFDERYSLPGGDVYIGRAQALGLAARRLEAVGTAEERTLVE